jgi:hypothetical protein
MRIFLVMGLLLFTTVNASFAQSKRKNKPVSYQRHYNEILPKAPQFKPNGWIFAPGATYMLTPFLYQKSTYPVSDSSEYIARARGLGKPGIYAEIGRYRMLPYGRLFKYFDYGVSYTGLRGSERSNGQLESIPEGNNLGSLTQAQGTYGFHYAQSFFNLNNVWRISKYNFVQQSIGLNAGYAFLANQGGATVAPIATLNPGRVNAQLHYKIGYGIKMRGNWLIIPSIETPVLNLWKWENGRSSMAFFASRYRPIMFSLRIFLMRPSNTMDCTPVRTREGVKMPTDMDKQQQLQDGPK